MSQDLGNVYYKDYLQLNKILGAQQPISDEMGAPAHDELLFIIVHQAYELWFKQIIFELDSVKQIFADPPVDDKQMGIVIARLDRILTIQGLLLDQIDVIETMTPLDFLEFRDLLVPASGFQSIQFKEIEIRLGVRRENRIPADREFLKTRLADEDQAHLQRVESEPSLLELLDDWLGRMPFLEFGEFKFWEHYDKAVERMLETDKKIIQQTPTLTEQEKESRINELVATKVKFENLFDKAKFAELKQAGKFRLSHRAFLAALFINLYRNEPMLFLPFRLLTLLLEIDESFTRWRSRHALMVQRMLGAKIGTGGSSGHEYLNQTTRQNRVFLDLYNLATFLIPRSDLPELPTELRRSLGFHFSGQNANSSGGSSS